MWGLTRLGLPTRRRTGLLASLSEPWGFHLQNERRLPLPRGDAWGDHFAPLCPRLSSLTLNPPACRPTLECPAKGVAGRPVALWDVHGDLPNRRPLWGLAHVTCSTNTDVLALPRPQPSPGGWCACVWLWYLSEEAPAVPSDPPGNISDRTFEQVSKSLRNTSVQGPHTPAEGLCGDLRQRVQPTVDPVRLASRASTARVPMRTERPPASGGCWRWSKDRCARACCVHCPVRCL